MLTPTGKLSSNAFKNSANGYKLQHGAAGVAGTILVDRTWAVATSPVAAFRYRYWSGEARSVAAHRDRHGVFGLCTTGTDLEINGIEDVGVLKG